MNINADHMVVIGFTKVEGSCQTRKPVKGHFLLSHFYVQ